MMSYVPKKNKNMNFIFEEERRGGGEVTTFDQNLSYFNALFLESQ